uniref:Uncharacterized protein n=1 Tax=Anguilla anguilla TaxID=7936 RepID=A0A0E9WM76_ANGAN
MVSTSDIQLHLFVPQDLKRKQKKKKVTGEVSNMFEPSATVW